jgi:hypothetical protein
MELRDSEDRRVGSYKEDSFFTQVDTSNDLRVRHRLSRRLSGDGAARCSSMAAGSTVAAGVYFANAGDDAHGVAGAVGVGCRLHRDQAGRHPREFAIVASIVLVAVLAVFDPALAAVVAIMIVGLFVIIVPLVAILFDEREERPRRD